MQLVIMKISNVLNRFTGSKNMVRLVVPKDLLDNERDDKIQ